LRGAGVGWGWGGGGELRRWARRQACWQLADSGRSLSPWGRWPE
jgi:hypothetical protein